MSFELRGGLSTGLDYFSQFVEVIVDLEPRKSTTKGTHSQLKLMIDNKFLYLMAPTVPIQPSSVSYNPSKFPSNLQELLKRTFLC